MDHRGAARRMAAECLCFRARRASRLITRAYDEALRPLGIQATQLTLLNAVTMAGADGAPVARLAEVLGLDPTSLSRNLRALARAGLLAVGKLASDRRVRVARLTPEGERTVAEALPLWEEAHARIVGALGAGDAVALRERLDGASRRVGGAARS